ncbi:hypothetical protein PanWU01x14_116510 [Parasponia andersonii]|uniref:Uncharacterized protein n=1 Tax=Parasponia andersonii TaxID=3476 RepID=A0A2P5CWQ3_PARAD|nr:hypothetical protein PanWU01x14_116510 [Parasponia andersonii]
MPKSSSVMLTTLLEHFCEVILVVGLQFPSSTLSDYFLGLLDGHKPSSSLNKTLLEPIVNQAIHYLEHGHVDQLYASIHLAVDFEVHSEIIVPGMS